MIKKFLCIASCLLVCACGVKPGQVSAPEGSEEKAFPRTYPDTNTDPKP